MRFRENHCSYRIELSGGQWTRPTLASSLSRDINTLKQKLIFIAHRDRVLPKPTKAVELATLGNSEMTRDSLASEEVCRNFFGR